MIPTSTSRSVLPGISPTAEIIEEIQAGRMVVLVDDEDRENEGDLVLAAEFVTPEAINFMARYGRGLICLTLTQERCRQLNLPLMVSDNRSSMTTNFTVSIEAAKGVTTGISAADRAQTVKAAVARFARPEDLVQPGHVFPLMARRGGVLIRAGHTEAGCDLAMLANLEPCSVICEILKDDGEMARLPDLIEFAQQHHLKVGTIADLIHYRNQHEKLVERAGERELITPYGTFKVAAYYDAIANKTHLALIHGHIDSQQETLVRVHEPFSLVDIFDEEAYQHSFGIQSALRRITQAPQGVLVLLQGEESAEDLIAWASPNQELPQRKWDSRLYGVGAQILRDLGVTKMRVLSRLRKIPSMAGFGLEVVGYVTPNE
ncbi:MAG: bifunctional 3,4-dihydroxy-2-butanone-4-phosphate synthase/GTP cyclohydrolase II [Ferrovum sp. 37-45-19]|uniref:bifunctional 3,4-dihydroxy-2-butanone-4-phosphate synthase/GTP cyclohydrolase II n=1 Tax=Ferrovum sp. JA12 TaxID=1356299 RepID=UPI0007032815|nr:bifunctional 3,4-dihydroxy-2-butanone-4-phosphate synthase/GTP cyclohydrolase II [Ferrovum sp. JA12]OYV79841.1 MAG: bifunctional 3,4-dihydroxy-2-butanone-4-phosphate synthase/GTP cyclohydrolase II [Ferrovum sp. 21-44-67]OYV95465.1 MAG: bifunctional 3,4-dihydroxy-2-butanone-4-phosphate synthase/GTP cyclohydrolase II [Ferrovum sp. 37-45-19]HQT81261.1 bifunctional 3,4-dihydroxy-2-butanone-4-phosphate synthase/GTP cyclohydrolase II [Ferrovaceae bacterium]KRH78148.1 riboflavin biosynthesis protei